MYRINEATALFPTHYINGLASVKMPASQAFLEQLSPKTAAQLAMHFFERAQHLRQLERPVETVIMLLIFPDNMWRSELIVFQHAQEAATFLYAREATRKPWYMDVTGWEYAQYTEQHEEGIELIHCLLEK